MVATAILLLLFCFATLHSEAFLPQASISDRPRKLPVHVHLPALQSVPSKMDWTKLEPSNFRGGGSFLEGSQLAKDSKYLEAVLSLWESEERTVAVETSPLVYSYYVGEETTTTTAPYLLYGHVVRRTSTSNSNSQGAKSKSVPGILLFHTGAGPQDVCLFYKADVLAQAFDCAVMICDILSDESGWAWGGSKDQDRSHYNRVRESLMQNDASLLKQRVLAAIPAFCNNSLSLSLGLPEVDAHRMAAIGWCLGGQPILELGKIHSSDFSIKAMSTFHGVFRRDDVSSNPTQSNEALTKKINTSNDHSEEPEMLICNGMEDPFVSKDDLETAKNSFEENGYKVEILQLEGAKHGFSNPAQAFNENPAFGYNERAASRAWTATMELLQRALA
jgi:dienelactone hydrolase